MPKSPEGEPQVPTPLEEDDTRPIIKERTFDTSPEARAEKRLAVGKRLREAINRGNVIRLRDVILQHVAWYNNGEDSSTKSYGLDQKKAQQCALEHILSGMKGKSYVTIEGPQHWRNSSREDLKRERQIRIWDDLPRTESGQHADWSLNEPLGMVDMIGEEPSSMQLDASVLKQYGKVKRIEKCFNGKKIDAEYLELYEIIHNEPKE